MIPNIRFTAIDFETASASRSSCCSIGLIYWDGFTESKWSTLVNPGNIQFTNSHIHNITKRSVQNQPTFADVFETLNSYINKSDFVVAHNAQFDRSVLTATCHKNLINISEPPWFCTRVASTKISKAISHDLESIAKRLGIKFTHHDAQEDAEACYKIFCKFLQKAGDWDKLLAKVGFIKRLQNTTFRAAPREMQISAKDISKFMNQLHNENRGPIEDLLIQSYHDFRDTWSPDIDYKNIAFKKDSQNALIDLRDYCAGYLSFLPTYKKLISEIDHDFLVGHALFNVLKIANAQGQLNEIYELLGSCKKYANKPDFLILENGKISIRPRDKSCVIDTEFTNPRTPKFDLFASRKFLCGTVLDVATMQSQTFIDPAAMINRIYEYDTIYSYNGEGFDFALLSQFGLHVNEAEC